MPNKIKLGINLLPYTPGQQGGAEVYIRNLVASLPKHASDMDLVLFVSKKTKGLYTHGLDQWTEVVIPFDLNSRANRIIAEQFLLPLYIKKHKIDWLFSNYVLPLAAPCKHIINIHDMLYKRHPEWIGSKAKTIYWSFFIPLSARRATKVFTVSNFSARDIEQFFPHIKEKIFVTVEGINRWIANSTGERRHTDINSMGIQKPYILSAATLGPNKNIPNLLRAFKIVNETYADLSIVLTGKKEKAEQELAPLIKELGISDKINFVGFVSDDQLATLYKNARLHVMPSMFEGFGLSVIEAQHFECPVVCSNTASLPEIAGSGGILFDPHDIKDMASKIMLVLKDAKTRGELIKRGRENLSRFSWDKAATDVINAIKDANTTPDKL